MPFIRQEDRGKPVDKLVSPGEKCFCHYRRMIRQWRDFPCWTTVDKIASGLWPDDQRRAEVLAFLVFFSLHAMPYELKKREEHGEVE